MFGQPALAIFAAPLPQLCDAQRVMVKYFCVFWFYIHVQLLNVGSVHHSRCTSSCSLSTAIDDNSCASLIFWISPKLDLRTGWIQALTFGLNFPVRIPCDLPIPQSIWTSPGLLKKCSSRLPVSVLVHLIMKLRGRFCFLATDLLCILCKDRCLPLLHSSLRTDWHREMVGDTVCVFKAVLPLYYNKSFPWNIYRILSSSWIEIIKYIL